MTKPVILVGSIGSLKAATIMAGTFYALQDLKYNIIGMAGVSGSSIVTPLLAAGISRKALTETIAAIPPSSLNDSDWLQQLLDKARKMIGLPRKGDQPFTGIMRGNGIERAIVKMYDQYHCASFNDKTIPYLIIATIIAQADKSSASLEVVEALLAQEQAAQEKTGYNDTEKVFGPGDDVRVSDAVRASITIPGVFRPKYIRGIGTLVDGGAVDAIPVWPALKEFAPAGGVDVVLADATTDIIESPYGGKDIDNVVDALIASLYATVRSNTQKLLDAAQEELNKTGDRMLRVNPKVSIKMFQTGKFPSASTEAYFQAYTAISRNWGASK